jgi:hypothetical protein
MEARFAARPDVRARLAPERAQRIALVVLVELPFRAVEMSDERYVTPVRLAAVIALTAEADGAPWLGFRCVKDQP